MKITDHELSDLIRCSEWLQSDPDDVKGFDKELMDHEKRYRRLTKKLIKFYTENDKESYQLK